MPLRWICVSASVVLCLGSRPDERGLPSAQAVASLDRRATQTGPVPGRESGPILGVFRNLDDNVLFLPNWRS